MNEAPRTDPKQRLRVGVCCSGGGIRSACFSLGALVELRRQGVFDEAVSIAAVSGGSFAVAAYVTTCATSEISEDDLPPWSIDSPEMSELRRRCDYLASGSSERYWLVLSAIRSSIINLLAAGFLMFGCGHLLGALLSLSEEHDATIWLLLGTSAPSALLLILSLGLVAINSWLARLGRGLLGDVLLRRLAIPFAILAVGSLTLLLVLPGVLDYLHESIGQPLPADPNLVLGLFPTLGSKATILLVASGCAALVAFVLFSLALPKPWRDVWRGLVAFAMAVTILAGPFVWAFDGARGHMFRVGFVAAGVDALALIALALLFDANSYSLLPIFRGSLRRTLFWRRVGLGECSPRTAGTAGKPEGVALSRLSLVDLHDRFVGRGRMESMAGDSDPSGTSDASCPFTLAVGSRVVLLGSLNLSDRGADGGTEVENIAFSRSVGSPTLGQTDGSYYDQALGDSEKLDLGTIVAISGAAISPTMGRFTRRSVSALLALLNLRLGVWLTNPRRGVGARKVRPTAVNVLAEALGVSPADGTHVFVSDGGHYENLGLASLADDDDCDLVVSIDASYDPPGERASLQYTLGLLRSRGFSYTLDDDPAAGADGVLRSPVLWGWIQSPVGRWTRFVHLRCDRYEELSSDLQGVIARNPRFPRHPTLHQFFSAELVDAYYLLGRDVASVSHIGERVRPDVPLTADGFW